MARTATLISGIVIAAAIILSARPVAVAQEDTAIGSLRAMSAGESAGSAALGEFATRLVNADDVPTGWYTGVVRITFRVSKQPNSPSLCSGIMVAKNVVLTAAHCSCGILESYRFARQQELQVALGNASIKQQYAIRPPVRFPGYDCSSNENGQPGRDLALFFVRNEDEADRLNFNSTNSTLLASMHSVYGERTKRLVAAGFGWTEDRRPSDRLQYGFISIGSYFCSTGRFAGTPCAGFREFVLGTQSSQSAKVPVDTCDGDSGGPVFWYPQPTNDPQIDDRFPENPILVGITSRALLQGDHLPGMLCGGGGVYTAVGHSDVINWLWSWGVQVAVWPYYQRLGQ